MSPLGHLVITPYPSIHLPGDGATDRAGGAVSRRRLSMSSAVPPPKGSISFTVSWLPDGGGGGGGAEGGGGTTPGAEGGGGTPGASGAKRGTTRHEEPSTRYDGDDEEVRLATRKVRAFMKGRTVYFNGAGDSKLGTVEQAWDLDFVGDRSKARTNREVLDGIAAIMRDFPRLGMQVHAHRSLVITP